MYLSQVSMDEARMAALPEGQRILIESAPGWQTGAFAIAVFSGLFGSIGLLMRKMWSRVLFIISLLAVLVQFAWSFLIADALGLLGQSALILPLFIIVIAVLLVYCSTIGARRGWLR